MVVRKWRVYVGTAWVDNVPAFTIFDAQRRAESKWGPQARVLSYWT